MREKDPHCTGCASLMYRAYRRRQDGGRRSWLAVGWICPLCNSYRPDE